MRTPSQQIIDRKLVESFSYDAETGLVRRKKTGEIVGSPNKAGYLRVSFMYRSYYLQRLAWFLHFGVWPIEEVDHKNKNVQDNKLVNLREATRVQNGCNRNTQTNNTSGQAGVYWSNKERKWRAAVQVGGAVYHIGAFDNVEDAKNARLSKANELHGEFSADRP